MLKNRKKEWPKDANWPQPTKYVFDYDENTAPMELDEEAEDLLEIKEYYDSLKEEDTLDEEYRLKEREEDFQPEKGEDYWHDNAFWYDAWQEDFSEHVNLLKIDFVQDTDKDPITAVRNACGYDFINENLLRQAFTRRAFAIEYGLEAEKGMEGCSEELEFIGDSVINMVVTREIVRQYTECDCENIEAPFKSKYREGELSKLRSGFISKEYLSKRAKTLGLDQYILYAAGEETADSSREDMMEALIGAIAVDCGWDMPTLERTVNRLLYIQLDCPDDLLKKSYYELLNSWHQKHFGCIPDIEVHGGSREKNAWKPYRSVIRFSVPENEKGISTAQCLTGEGETVSEAREDAAREAYGFLYKNGLWMDLKNAGITPDRENSINQLQELYQKKYLEALPEYEFEEDPDGRWQADCRVGAVLGWGNADSKVKAKKKAAYMALIRLMQAAGICDEKLRKTMYDI